MFGIHISYIHGIVLSFIVEQSVKISANFGHRWFGCKWNHIETSISYMYNMCIYISIYIYICKYLYVYIYIMHIYIYRYCRVLRIPSSRSFQFQAAQQLDPGLEPPHGVCQGPNGLVGKSWHKKTRHSTIV